MGLKGISILSPEDNRVWGQFGNIPKGGSRVEGATLKVNMTKFPPAANEADWLTEVGCALVEISAFDDNAELLTSEIASLPTE